MCVACVACERCKAVGVCDEFGVGTCDACGVGCMPSGGACEVRDACDA